MIKQVLTYEFRVFIIDGIITCPIAIMGYLYFPDTPELTKAPYLSTSEKELALARLPPKLEDGHNINPWSLLMRTIKSPALFVCPTHPSTTSTSALEN
jgi:ACS family pantothenate transporter-like MFS transporter